MKFVRLSVVSVLLVSGAVAAPLAPATGADDWLTRCNHPLGDDNGPEAGRYLFETRGTALGAPARAELDYTANGSPTATVYPTEAKGLMNPYGGASVGLGYYGLVASKPPYAMVPKIGHVSMSAIAKDFMPLPGHVTMKLVIDGASFGPYEPKASSAKDGQYSIWFDTADTDGDSQPPILKSAQFAALAKAAGAMKAAQVVIVQDGKDVAVMPVSPKSVAQWRDELPKWAAATRAGIKTVTFCQGDDRSVN